LIQDKTIEENIIVALDIISFPKDDVSARVDQVLKNVGLLSRRHLFPAQLSGGELQRASLARALSIDPKIILADEPTGNLDPENTWNLMKLLKQINHKLGVTVIMTTHNYEIIEAMNKRTITIKSGNLVEDKSPLISKKLQTKKS
jgi:cell division transport system ATP-binding protein